jgi:ketosteroid isomerase-like protein
MKKFLLIFSLVISGILASAQSKSEKQVAEAVQQLRKAMVDPDKAILDKLTLSGLSYGHSSGKIDTKDSFIGDLVTGKSDFLTIDLSEQTISVFGKTALVRHTFIGALNEGGRTSTVKLHILSVWQKSGGGWKMLARQATRIP